uniref:Uncharacterized protein n=1 Tax=Timema monikensis TaxID=170555 RepID=A0A7R9EG03_9NEOP|nr:unnamed protein product [Timema monikensis]
MTDVTPDCVSESDLSVEHADAELTSVTLAINWSVDDEEIVVLILVGCTKGDFSEIPPPPHADVATLLLNSALFIPKHGYQPPGNTDVFWRAKENTPDSRRGTGKKLGKSPRVSEEQFAALGLRKGPKRAHRNPGGGGGGHGKAQKGAAAGGEGSDVQDV